MSENIKEQNELFEHMKYAKEESSPTIEERLDKFNKRINLALNENDVLATRVSNIENLLYSQFGTNTEADKEDSSPTIEERVTNMEKRFNDHISLNVPDVHKGKPCQ